MWLRVLTKEGSLQLYWCYRFYIEKSFEADYLVYEQYYHNRGEGKRINLSCISYWEVTSYMTEEVK